MVLSQPRSRNQDVESILPTIQGGTRAPEGSPPRAMLTEPKQELGSL
jgi:hypothetical protein